MTAIEVLNSEVRRLGFNPTQTNKEIKKIA